MEQHFSLASQQHSVDKSSLKDFITSQQQPAVHKENDIDFDDGMSANGGKMSLFPSPEDVLKAWHQAGGPDIIPYIELNLVVKVGGNRVRLDEAIALQFVRRSLPSDEVPIPEVHGWRVRDGYSMIYMSYALGPTLDQAWESLTCGEKEAICEQLGSIVASLRSIPTCSTPIFIGSAAHGPARDIFLGYTEQSGGCDSVASFHDLLSAVAIPSTLPSKVPDPYRDLLPDSCSVYFTHGDLTLTNIILAGDSGSRRISSIIDWEQAGWYPEYWEYCKLHLGVNDEHEWRAAGWADRVVRNYETEFFVIAEYYQFRPP